MNNELKIIIIITGYNYLINEVRLFGIWGQVSMRLVILDDYDKASEWAAKYVRNRILQFNPSKEKPFVLGLPTGEVYNQVLS